MDDDRGGYFIYGMAFSVALMALVAVCVISIRAGMDTTKYEHTAVAHGVATYVMMGGRPRLVYLAPAQTTGTLTLKPAQLSEYTNAEHSNEQH